MVAESELSKAPVDSGRETGSGWKVATFLALLGLAVSGYLAVVGWTAAGLPIGCGGGGGCASVLTSRWAGTWGIPVAIPAVGLWLVAAIAAATRARLLACLVAVALVLGAIWFVGLQLLVVKAICPWCMADHAIGVVFSAVVIGLCRARPTSATVALAAIATGGIVLGQFLVPYHPGRVGQLTLGPGTSSDGAIVVNGMSFGPEDSPWWGAADGTHTIVLLADYACPHCRATHEYLSELLRAAPNRFRVLVAPVPMDHDCNRTLIATEPRFEHSCELAQLAIALWKADHSKFPEFDAWLFAPETPRTPEEARQEADRLVGREAMSTALADSPLPSIVARNVDAFEAVHAARLPVILRADGPSIEGEPANRDELDRLLRSTSPTSTTH